VANIFRRTLSNIGYTLKAVSERPGSRQALRHVTVLFAMACVALTCVTTKGQTSAFVPVVVASSVSAVPTTTYATPTAPQTNLLNPTNVALDGCGNIYTLDNGYQTPQETPRSPKSPREGELRRSPTLCRTAMMAPSWGRTPSTRT
jgi:hypothetical protein